MDDLLVIFGNKKERPDKVKSGMEYTMKKRKNKKKENKLIDENEVENDDDVAKAAVTPDTEVSGPE
jgi:hypothetical protein